MTIRGKSEKVSVTLPRELVGEIRATVPHGEVSSFFTEAVRQYLAFHRQRTALKQGFGAWKSNDHPDLATPGDSTAYVRSIRETDRERPAQPAGNNGK